MATEDRLHQLNPQRCSGSAGADPGILEGGGGGEGGRHQIMKVRNGCGSPKGGGCGSFW